MCSVVDWGKDDDVVDVWVLESERLTPRKKDIVLPCLVVIFVDVVVAFIASLILLLLSSAVCFKVSGDESSR